MELIFILNLKFITQLRSSIILDPLRRLKTYETIILDNAFTQYDLH